MGKKTTSTATPAGVAGPAVITDHYARHLAGKALGKVAPHTVPWLAGGGMIPLAVGTHAWWGTPEALPWASAGLALSGAALTGVTWAISRYRHLLGRLQSTGTTAVASGWLLAATITGPTARPTLDIGLWLGGTLAAAWNIRNIIRLPGSGDEVEAGAVLSGPGLFKKFLTGTAEAAGLDIEVGKVKTAPHSITGTVELSEGDTVEDLQRAIPAMEAAARLPSGSLVATPDLRNAGEPTLTMSNPLVLEEPVRWPGPSRPGGSAADPLRVALFQDGSPVQASLVGPAGPVHVQIMGMTGSAKSTGGAWSLWGELVTRPDVALMVIDITKREQTLGPARPALHRVETTKAGAKKLIEDLQVSLPERTDYLTSKNLIGWEPGCGLSFLVLWLEEAADIFEHIDMETFINLCRAMRSAGGAIVWSLQRADSTQVPTIVKGQAGAFFCFGVGNDHDAGWGLSDKQDKAGATPELWMNTKPGMAYGEAPGISSDRIAMPMRFFDWGATNEQRVLNFRAHCQAYPATARPVDAITARICPTPGALSPAIPAMRLDPTTQSTDDPFDSEVTTVAREYITPDPELDGADATSSPVDPETPLPDVDDVPLGDNTKRKLSPEQAQRVLDEVLATFADGREFKPIDLGHVLTTTGMTRQWIQKHLKARVQAGQIHHDRDSNTYRFPVMADSSATA